MAVPQKFLIEPVQHKVTDNIEQLLTVLPPEVCRSLKKHNDLNDLLEIVMDLGRYPEARFPNEVYTILDRPINQEDLDYVTARVGAFGEDNRAGIERTLHRISAIRNRLDKVVGLTCRIGRAVYGTIDIIRDVVEGGQSVLMLGRPGVGKTTKLREVARILSDEFSKRVVIVDTSNEIAGDGDIPHPAIGRARRMQVPTPEKQHAVMIEAVENHMPEVIVIDEIGTEQEAFASRTIAERGVQLVGTAHGNSLENLLMNPTLSDLVGGIQAVTLSDDEAKRRGTQKTVLERKAPPTFDVVIEILEVDKLAIHHDVQTTVDRLLRGAQPRPEIRVRQPSGEVEVVQKEESRSPATAPRGADGYLTGGRPMRGFEPESSLAAHRETSPTVRVYPYGVSRNRLEKAIRELRLPLYITKDLNDADAVIALKAHARRDSGRLQDAIAAGKPTYVVRSNTYAQVAAVLREMFDLPSESAPNDEEYALREAEDAAELVQEAGEPVELQPRNSYIRRLQHEIIQRYDLTSESIGVEPNRRVRVTPVTRVVPSFITFEGPDGSGKTTQAALLAERLREDGREAVLTREPGGGGPVAGEVRRLLLHGSDMAAPTEMLLFFAARAEHVAALIRPALARGAAVVCDRYTDSTLAYQGAGLGMDEDAIRALHRFATGDLWPDATILLDLPPDVGLRRQDNPNRMEERGLEFACRVREGFLDLARREPSRIHVVDARGTIVEVHARVLAALGLEAR